MKKILKYTLKRSMECIDLPSDAKVVYVGNQNNSLTMWAEVNTTRLNVIRTFITYGTGFDIEPGDVYVGSAIDIEGFLVLHVYERP